MCRRHAIFGELDDELKLWRFVDKFPVKLVEEADMENVYGSTEPKGFYHHFVWKGHP